MSNWEEEPLEKVMLFIKDGSHGTHKDYENGIPLLSAKDIEKGKVLIPEDCRKISEKDFDQIHTNYQILENDIALTIVGTIGRVAIIENKIQKFTFQRSVGIFRVDTAHIYPKYCFHYFTSNRFQEALERSKNASAQGGVYLGELAKIKISYPSISEQRQIATILSTADAVIEKTQAAIAKYKAIKQGMLQDLFTRGILTKDIKYKDKNGTWVERSRNQLRPSYQDAPELYKESKLGWIPKEWEVERIDKLCQITTGNKDTQNKQEYGEYAFFVRSQTVEKIDSYSYDGEAILTAGDGVGVGKIYHYINGKFDFHQRVYMLYEFEKIIAPKFLFYYFSTNFLAEVDRCSAKTTVDSVRMEMIAGMIVPLPNISEQISIAEKLITLESKLQTEQDFLHKQQQIKAGLMNDLLSGRKKVSIKENITSNE